MQPLMLVKLHTRLSVFRIEPFETRGIKCLYNSTQQEEVSKIVPQNDTTYVTSFLDAFKSGGGPEQLILPTLHATPNHLLAHFIHHSCTGQIGLILLPMQPVAKLH